jgi:hypothetical protein
MVEINTGIICSCLPTLRALVSRFWPAAFTTKELKSMTTNASEGQYLKVHSDTSTSFKSSSDRLDLQSAIANSDIASHALYVRNHRADHRDPRPGEMVSAPVPTNLPDGARIHVFTTVDVEDANDKRMSGSAAQRSEFSPDSSQSRSKSSDRGQKEVRFDSGQNQIKHKSVDDVDVESFDYQQPRRPPDAHFDTHDPEDRDSFNVFPTAPIRDEEYGYREEDYI